LKELDDVIKEKDAEGMIEILDWEDAAGTIAGVMVCQVKVTCEGTWSIVVGIF
jgi:hypothetical protein